MTIAFEQVGMFTMVSMAVIWDFKTWKIPNWLVLAGLETGIFSTIRREGWAEGIFLSGKGILIPIGLLFFLFAVGFLGAGDIKLLSAVGAFVGIQIGEIMLYAFLAGGVLSVVYIGKYRLIPMLQKKTRMSLGRQNRIHFSLAIWIGCLYYLLSIGYRLPCL